MNYSCFSLYAQFLVDIGESQRKVSLMKVTRWALRDRKKFAILISDLRSFIGSLRELVPVNQHRQ